MHGASKNICFVLWMFIYSPKILVTGKRNKGHISPCLHRTPPHFHVRTQTISRPSKSMHAHDTFTRDGHWTSEKGYYGHRIHSRGDHTVSSSWYVSVFSWWHWRTLHLMRAPYFVEDTYGHCIWSESTIWSLDFRISSSWSPHTLCRANQHVVGWLGRQWFLEPTRVKVPVLAFILG